MSENRLAAVGGGPGRHIVIAGLGLTQILAWGSSYYLPAVVAGPIAADTGWPLSWVIAGLSLGLLIYGAVSARAGREIDRRGGRPVLAASSLLLAGGLALLAAAQTLPVFLIGWCAIGAGMGTGLYDAAFGVLGRLYGLGARRAITTLTLFGGFASTVCWPLSAWLVETVGWRGTCLAYTGLHLCVALPIHLFLVPRATLPAAVAANAPASAPAAPGAIRGRVFALLALCFTIGAVTSSIMAVHLLGLLQSRGFELATAVALGTLIGPAQVGARAVEMVFGSRYHPIWTLGASTLLMASGFALLLLDLPLPAPALVLYGAGLGILSIARGTLPLALFGEIGFATLVGRLAMPSLLAQSLAPAFGAVLLERGGAQATILVLAGLALLNVAVFAALRAACRRVAPPA